MVLISWPRDPPASASQSAEITGTSHCSSASILKFNKTDFKSTKAEKRQKSSLYNDKMINSSRRYNYPKYYEPNYGALRFRKQLLAELRKEIDHDTIIMGDFSTPLCTRQILEAECQQRNTGSILHSRKNIPNRYFQDILLKNIDLSHQQIEHSLRKTMW